MSGLGGYSSAGEARRSAPARERREAKRTGGGGGGGGGESVTWTGKLEGESRK